MNSHVRVAGRIQKALVATAIGATLGAGLLVWARTEIRSLQYRLTRLVDHETTLRAEVEKLSVEVAALSAPARIEKRARALGLRDPAPGQLVSGFTRERVAADVAAGPWR